MPLSCGVVGLPNAGKSTLFNALTRAGAEVAGYPFCTVDCNVGTTLVPDARLAEVARFAGAAKATPTTLQVTDIAGLVRGASRGEGLGNKFLGHVREADALLHVVRCYANQSAPHVLGEVDPVRDVGVIAAELMLADLATIERRRERIRPEARVGEPAARHEDAALVELAEHLDAGREVRLAPLGEAAARLAPTLNLLTAKPVVFVANVPDPDVGEGAAAEAWCDALAELAGQQDDRCVTVYARALMDLGEFGADERDQVAAELGISTDPLGDLITAAYGALDLITFFTANRNEARAWTLHRGASAVLAAGKVHTDMARGFIAAEVIKAADAARYATRGEALSGGAVRTQGRDYVVADGDLLEFRFSV